MKGYALSVRQPWASLIVCGVKTVEIRFWSTEYRGNLFIHAAKTVDDVAMRRFRLDAPPTGSLVGAVELVRVEPFTAASWDQLALEHLDLGSFSPGLYAWHLTNPRALESPIAYRGDRGLFSINVPCEDAQRAPEQGGLLF
jgi:activating signal cointegrator 1